jgi:hypothetical protein
MHAGEIAFLAVSPKVASHSTSRKGTETMGILEKVLVVGTATILIDHLW